MNQIARKLIVETPIYDYDITVEEQNRGSEMRYYISGPYMQYDTKNKNNRKYIKEEMLNDVERFQREMIDTGRAGGELGHCVPSSYKILTTDGWKVLSDIDDNEEIYSLNIETDEIEKEVISQKIKQSYKGKMIRIKGAAMDAIFTPNHRILLEDNVGGKRSYVTAQEIKDNDKDVGFLGKRLVRKNDEFQHDKEPFSFKVTNYGRTLDSHEITEEEYDGEIGCVVAPKNSNWYCMDENGKTFWTGNSTEPEIDLSRLCHKILSLEHDEKGKHFIGRSLVLSTPSGKILESLIKDKVKTGMSTKALGQIKESNDSNIVTNFYLVGVDAVYDPSYSSAFVNGILESKEFIINSDNKFEQAYDKFESGLSKYPSRYRDEINKHIQEQVLRFLQAL